MRSVFQDAVCDFVRQILEARTGEKIAVTERPEQTHRNEKVVEELWESRSRRYAVEHTRVESFDGQIGNEAKLRQLLLPVAEQLKGRLAGTYVLSAQLSETQAARIKFADAHAEIVRLVLQLAPTLGDRESIVLPSNKLPFRVQLYRRNDRGSHLGVHTVIEGDGEALRLERMKRALAEKCPKLAEWSADGRVSVLVLEANDLQLSNSWAAYGAFMAAISERNDQPDIVVFVETDGAPMFAWIFKEGEQFGDAVPMPDGHRCYEEGAISNS